MQEPISVLRRSFQAWDFHYKDKRIMRLSYSYSGIIILVRCQLYIEIPPWIILWKNDSIFTFSVIWYYTVIEIIPHGRQAPLHPSKPVPWLVMDGLVMQGARASTATVLMASCQNIPSPAKEGLIVFSKIPSSGIITRLTPRWPLVNLNESLDM